MYLSCVKRGWVNRKQNANHVEKTKHILELLEYSVIVRIKRKKKHMINNVEDIFVINSWKVLNSENV